MWKKAGVTEKTMTKFLLCLDHDTVQEIKDNATAEALGEKMFGTAED